jgi:hypothetical protein
VEDAVRDALAALDESPREERLAALCFLAGQRVEIDAGERSAALRRTELLLAAGGDPRRTPELDGRAVRALASDLDAPDRREALRSALEELADGVEELPGVSEALQALLADGDLAWHAFALGLLAERDDD